MRRNTTKILLQRSLALALCCSLSFAFSQDTTYNKNHDKHSLALELRYGLMSASGDLNARADRITGVNGKNEINVAFPSQGNDATFNYAALAVAFRLNKYHFSLEVNPLNYRAKAETEDSLYVEGVLVPPGSSLDVISELGIYSFVVTRDIIEGKRGEFGIGLGIMLIDYNFGISIDNYLEEETISHWLPAPTIAIRYTYNTPKWELNARLAGVAVRAHDIELGYMDADFSGRYKIYKKEPWIGMITAGIRYLPLFTSAEYLSEDYGPIYMSSSSIYIGPYIGIRFELVGDYKDTKPAK
jgi:hypothetical protein